MNNRGRSLSASPPDSEPIAPLVALEGIDGAGTTTQAALLTKWLIAHSLPAEMTREPSTGPIGVVIRRALAGQELNMGPSALALLFAADRLEHQREFLTYQRASCWVITDRYVYSSLAYQSLDLDPNWVAAINGWAREPDLTIYLRVDPEIAAARRAARGGPAEIFETAELQARAAANYDALFLDPSVPTPGATPQIRRCLVELAGLSGEEKTPPAPTPPAPNASGPSSGDPLGSADMRRSSPWGPRLPTVAVVDGNASVRDVTEAVCHVCTEFALRRGIWIHG